MASSMYNVKSTLYVALQSVLSELSIASEEECHRLCTQANTITAGRRAVKDNWALRFLPVV